MRKILVVDDDPDLLDLLNVGLTEAGYSVITAANGRDALEQARSLPDLIVLDLVLPEMDGFTVCQALKRDRATASIPVLLLSGLSSQLSRFAGLECGAMDYVTKPVTLSELLPRIQALVASKAGLPPVAQAGSGDSRRRARAAPPATA